MKTNRRTFLEGAGVSVSLPLLESFGGASSVEAAPKRMIAS